MNAINLEDLTQKLQNDTASILEKIWGYADALLENRELAFTLSNEQKKILTDQDNVSLEECTDAEDFYKELKEKYEL